MGRKTNTRQLIIEAAINEFLEKGYENTTLRNICKKANTTTGSFYFFFKDKDELFKEIVSPLEKNIDYILSNMLDSHNTLSNFTTTPIIVDKNDIITNFKYIFSVFMQYQKEAIILFNKSQKSYKENFLNSIIESYTQANLKFLLELKLRNHIASSINEYSLKMYFKCFFTAFIDLVTSNLSYDEMEEQLQFLISMVYGSWEELFNNHFNKK